MAAGDPILAADYAGIRLATIDQPVVRMTASGTMALASGGTAVLFSGEDFDPYGYHSTVTNTGRITPTKAGYYWFEGGVYIASSANIEAAWLRKNGATAIASGPRDAPPASAQVRGLSGIGAQVWMNGTTDYMELIADPAGVVSTSQSVQFSSWFGCFLMGRQTNP